MCSGRVDPVMTVEAFRSGSDGVFVGACKRGECHYSSGNLHAEARVELVKRVLEVAGINPERLVMRMMSSAEGNKFVEFTTEFQEKIRNLGPLGKAEGLSEEDLKIKLKAIRDALNGRKLRWVVGKIVEFKEKGNLYGERFTDHEIRRLLQEVSMDEVRIREILERLKLAPQSVKDLSNALKTPARIVLRQMADLKRMGLAEIGQIDGRTPIWKLSSEAPVYE